jgi:peptidoglycan/LPS O-acetylase OafA/YrhL
MTHDHPVVYYALGFPLVNVCVALSVDWAVTYSEGLVGRVLNARPLVFVGVMSYSLYLWQQPFLHRASSAALTAFPLNIIVAVALALASFYLVERPSLRLRRRIERALDRRRAPAPRDTGPVDAGVVPST